MYDVNIIFVLCVSLFLFIASVQVSKIISNVVYYFLRSDAKSENNDHIISNHMTLWYLNVSTYIIIYR